MLSVKEIMQILPHRYPFLLVDRIEELELCKHAVGIKNVTINEEFFNGHFPGEPIMPGVLILEAIAQVGAISVLADERYKNKILLFAGLDKVRFRRKVVPGDTLRLETEILKMKLGAGAGHGIATVNGEKACEADFTFAMTDR